jgi:hypothetical protein
MRRRAPRDVCASKSHLRAQPRAGVWVQRQDGVRVKHLPADPLRIARRVSGALSHLPLGLI